MQLTAGEDPTEEAEAGVLAVAIDLRRERAEMMRRKTPTMMTRRGRTGVGGEDSSGIARGM